MILKILFLAFVSGLFYRLGGEINKNIRRFGCSVILILSLMVMFGINQKLFIPYFITFALSYLSLVGYNKWVGKLFGAGDDVVWQSWFFTGITYALAVTPICVAAGHWTGFALRLITLPALVTFVSEKSDNVYVEELSRGFLIVITLLFLLIK